MKKGINKKIVIIHPFAQKAPRERICTKFGTATGVTDIITTNKFFGDRFRGVDSMGGQILPSPIDSQSPLTQGWQYRAARDKSNLIGPCFG